jgi:alpha-D-xyloside xylohydrolase
MKTQIKKGAKFYVVDYGDGVPEEALFSNGKTGKEMRQYFLFLYNKVAYEATTEVLGVGNVANIARPGYIGTQKFPGK